MTELTFELNPLWLVLFALVAGGFSFFLYFNYKSEWPNWFNKVFSVVRFVVVFFALLLLLGPFLKRIKNTTETPRVNVIVDNSTSLSTYSNEVNTILSGLKKEASSSKKLDYEFFTLNGTLTDSLIFDQKTTNLSKTLKSVDQATAGLNTVATILVTDGIVNQGLFLEGLSSTKDLFAVGVGDTTERKDLLVKELFVNKSTFLGNEFPVQATILSKGFSGSTTRVNLLINGKKVSTKKISFKAEESIQEVSFNYTSKKKGFIKLGIQLEDLEGETTTKNNSKFSFVKVNESKQKVALVSRNPHPDIKALVASINSLEKYEVEVFNLSFNKKKPAVSDFDIFILHQLPCNRCGNDKLVEAILSSKKPRWLINGIHTRLRIFNDFSASVKISNARGVDEVGGLPNSNFDLFEFDDLDLTWLKYSPPLVVPYANYRVSPEATVVMDQMVGSVASSKPLIVYKEDKGVKELALLGEGIWKWKMTESLEKNSTKNFDLLVSKLIGLLNQSRKDVQFSAVITNEQYNVSNQPKFSFVSKNQVGELIYSNEINLSLSREKKKVADYSITVSEENSFYSLPLQDTGVYNYVASTTIGGKEFREVGLFSVEDIQLESKKLQADFSGLKEVTSLNSGGFFISESLGNLVQEINNRAYKNKIRSNEERINLKDLFWPLLFLLIFISTEWLARKAFGDI